MLRAFEQLIEFKSKQWAKIAQWHIIYLIMSKPQNICFKFSKNVAEIMAICQKTKKKVIGRTRHTST